MAFEKDRAYTYTGTVQVGKFAAVKPGTGKSDFVLSTSQNEYCIGIVLDAIVPELAGGGYKAGSYGGVSGVAWPANVFPGTPVGLKRTVRTGGRCQAVAAGTINRGDRVISAGNGLVQSAETAISGLAASTPIFVIGIADTSSSANGDLVYLDVDPHKEIV